MKRLTLIFAALTALILCSCEHKELCYSHPHSFKLRVDFDWRNAPEAFPKGMCVFFYPEDGGEPKRIDCTFSDGDIRTGGEVELMVGKYRVITYNNDTEGVKFANYNTFDSYYCYTREGNILEPIYGNGANYAPRAAGTEEERVVITPDMMWGCAVTELEVKTDGVRYCCIPDESRAEEYVTSEQQIILYPCEITCIYTYEVINVLNLKHATDMCATISGMAGSHVFSTGELGSEPVSLPLEAWKRDDTTIEGRFYTFGHNAETADPHKMAFYVIMDDGNKYVYKDLDKYDVTKQVHEAPNRRRVHILIDGLELPTPIGNGSGFSPSVDDWIDENVDIQL